MNSVAPSSDCSERPGNLPLGDAVSPGRLFIDGKWSDAADGATKPTINPATEEKITDIAQATTSDVDRDVRAARRAFDDGAWPSMNIHQRARLLLRIADLCERDAGELAYRESIDMGKPLAMSQAFDVPMLAQLFRYYAGLATQLGGATRGGHSPLA